MKKILLTFQPVPTLIPLAEKEFALVRDEAAMSTERVLELALKTKPDALLVSHGQSYGAETIARLPDSVRVIATCSVGFEHIDLSACSARGIQATNTPDVLTDACADLTMFVLLGAARRGKEALALADLGWGRKLQQSELLGLDLRGKCLGIYGMGRIGRAVADRARGFGMKILYSNRRRLEPSLENGAQYFSSFHDMLPQCDFLSLHAPGSSDTQGVMGRREFALLPPHAIFINTSRGSLVDEDALIDALVSKKLFAAALDVCQNEPHPDPRLLSLPSVFLTPHIASATEETRLAMGSRALDNIRAVLGGKTPPDLLNG